MRKLATIAAIASLIPAGLGFGPPAILDSERAVAPLEAEQVAAIQRFKTPAISAASALVSDAQSGTVLFAQDPDSRRPMASLTKVMTALLALERSPLTAIVSVDVDASQMIDSSTMGLRPGEELTMQDLLYGLLLPSGNDAALAIAKYVGGTVPAFVDSMNRRAAEIGLHNTHFSNPHGLDAPDHYSSVADLVLLARTAMANATFAQIVGAMEYTARGKLASYRLHNTNQLLGQYLGVDGVKTGSTDAAGQCLIASAQRDEHRVFSAVIGSTDRFSDTKALLDYAFDDFNCGRLTLPANAFAVLPGGAAEVVAGGEGNAARLFISPEPWACRPAWQSPWLRSDWLFAEPDAESNAGTVGWITFKIDEIVVARAAVGRR